MPSIRSIIPFLGLALFSFQAAAAPLGPGGPGRPGGPGGAIITRTVTSCSTSKRPAGPTSAAIASSVSSAIKVSSATSAAAVAPSTTSAVVLPSTTAAAAVSSSTAEATALALPVNGGTRELNSTTLTLLHVTLGHGIQNYTCANASAVPVQVGALATLYDITSLAEAAGGAALIAGLSDEVVFMPNPAANLDIITATDPLAIPSVSETLPVIGHHYFLADGTPTFNLDTVNQILFGKKLDSIKAPTTASKGPAGTGTVDWLQLGDKGGSVGTTLVYRVVTAGGSAPATCQGQGTNGLGTGIVSVPYAAHYWFFG